MTDASALFLILVIIYLLDCMHLLHRNSVALTVWRGSNWLVRFAESSFGSKDSAVFFSPLLPPFGTTFISQPLPVSFAPDGVCSYIAQSLTRSGRPPQKEVTVRYDDIKRLSSESKDVLINGELFVHCRTNRIAEFVTGNIRKIAKAPPAGREALIDAMHSGMFDVSAVKDAAAMFSDSARTLRIMCNVLWIYMYVVCPVVVMALGFLVYLLHLASGLLVLHAAVVVGYWRLHRKLLPAESYARFEGLLKMVLCPPAAVRALDLVSLNLLDLYHPLAVVGAVAPVAEFRRTAVLMMRDARYPLPDNTGSKELTGLSDWHRLKMISVSDSFLKTLRMAVPEVDEQPAKQGGADLSYCPRCRTIYAKLRGVCSDCRGMELVEFRKGG